MSHVIMKNQVTVQVLLVGMQTILAAVILSVLKAVTSEIQLSRLHNATGLVLIELLTRTSSEQMRSVNQTLKHKEKIGVSYGWVYPVASRKQCRKLGGLQTLHKYFRLYCKYSSLVGFKYLVEDETTWIERLLWILIYGIAVSSLMLLIRGGYRDFQAAPVATTPDPDYYPTYELEFPGVSICSINRISRQAAFNLATEIYNANVTDMSVEEIQNLLPQMGDLYESSFIIENEHKKMDELLKKFYKGEYDVTGIMKRLSPQCSEILLLCVFHGQEANCSDIFTLRKTQDGFCCTFNYIAKPDRTELDAKDTEKRRVSKTERVGMLSITRGLTVVMDPGIADHMYSTYPISGLKVSIFDPYDYPDMMSGGLSEVFVAPLTERFVEMEAVSFYSREDIRPYPIKTRDCIFEDETPDGTYTYSDCIVNCKIAQVLQSCNCLPFYYPQWDNDPHRVCTLMDIPCLAQHKSEWLSIFSDDEDSESTELNTNMIEKCKDCHPSCNDISYIARTSTSWIDPGIYNTKLLQGMNITDQCVVHIYFNKLGSLRLKQDVVSRWYELLSDFGSICGVFVGFSLISVIELIYFAVLFMLELCNVAANPNEIENQHDTTSIQTIYWQELFPRSRSPGKLDWDKNRMLRY